MLHKKSRRTPEGGLGHFRAPPSRGARQESENTPVRGDSRPTRIKRPLVSIARVVLILLILHPIRNPCSTPFRGAGEAQQGRQGRQEQRPGPQPGHPRASPFLLHDGGAERRQHADRTTSHAPRYARDDRTVHAPDLDGPGRCDGTASRIRKDRIQPKDGVREFGCTSGCTSRCPRGSFDVPDCR